ncbi:MAG: hypothetical protein KGY76_01490 [Candidatus Thermoplasmatota archaeon]|nr:hypothetical protein [Candidatus Thermoplasmatota archaeon]
MKTKITFTAILIILIILSTSLIALAHVPRTGNENESLKDAEMVDDPTKSWVVYSELHEKREAQYYKMEMDEGEDLKLSLLVPGDGLVPNLVIMGPGIETNHTLPEYMDRPENAGSKVIEGELGEREYEPFTPGSYYHPAEYEENVEESGTYYAAVFSNESGGKYGLAVGYEERYGPVEWIRVPIDVVNIHIWEGQSLWLIFAPMILVLGGGLSGSIWWKYRYEEGPEDVKEWGLLTASFLYIGSGAMLLMQMGLAASKSSPGVGLILTLIFALLPIVFGILLWKNSDDFKDPERRSRVKVIVYGIIGLFVWAGLIIGPILAIISALLPKRITEFLQP